MTQSWSDFFHFLGFSFVSVCVGFFFLESKWLHLRKSGLVAWLGFTVADEKPVQEISVKIVCCAALFCKWSSAALCKRLSKVWANNGVWWCFLSSFFPRHIWSCVWHSLQNGHVAGRNHREDEGEGRTLTSVRLTEAESPQRCWSPSHLKRGTTALRIMIRPWSETFSLCANETLQSPDTWLKPLWPQGCQTQIHSANKFSSFNLNMELSKA